MLKAAFHESDNGPQDTLKTFSPAGTLDLFVLAAIFNLVDFIAIADKAR